MFLCSKDADFFPDSNDYNNLFFVTKSGSRRANTKATCVHFRGFRLFRKKNCKMSSLEVFLEVFIILMGTIDIRCLFYIRKNQERLHTNIFCLCK